MSNTTFVDQTTVVEAEWLNDVNDTVYDILGNGTIIPATKAAARTNLGATSVGDAVFTAVSTDAARAAVGATGFSDCLGRNKVINGKFNIAQRGTNFVGLANAYGLDRWATSKSTSAVTDTAQSTDVPSSNEFLYSQKITVTTADASIAAGDYLISAQGIEGYNARDLIGRTFTLSFWVRSAKTGVHCVAFRNSGADRAFVAEYTIDTADTWEKKEIVVTGGLITSGAWDWTNGSGLSVAFTLAGGTTWQTTAGVWQTGNFFSSPSQVNVLDTLGNVFALTGVQLEVGETATQFEHRPQAQELALCRHYYRQEVILGTGA